MTPREIIEGAIDLLNEKGWCQYTTARATDGYPVAGDDPRAASYCLYGLIVVQDNLWSWSPSVQGTLRFIEQHLGLPDGQGVSGWNDAPGRTKDEVLSLLKDAYAELPL